MNDHPNAIMHTVYTWVIDDHPNPEKVYDWVRDNWHYLGDPTVDDTTTSLAAFAKHFDCKVDWSISIVPDRGEYIRFIDLNWPMETYEAHQLKSYLHRDGYFQYCDKQGRLHDLCDGECPLTGCYTDEILLDAVREFRSKPDEVDMWMLLEDCSKRILESLHKEGEYIYSNEGLKQMLSDNEYEFKENGKIYTD